MEKPPVLTDKLQFHLLRHFSRVDDDYLENFVKASGYPPGEVMAQMEIRGSRFHYSFAPNPVVLWDKTVKLLKKGRYELSQNHGRNIYTFRFSENEYPGGIGLCYLVRLEDLPVQERGSVKAEQRGRGTVKVVSGIPPVPAHEMHMVEVTAHRNYISTIFPGTYAPPLPDREHQSIQEYAENTGFWERHAIIKE